MTKGLRLPSALRGRKLSAIQERLIHELYAAKERAIPHAKLRKRVFDEPVDQYRLMRLVHETRRTIQGAGWHITTEHGRGYKMVWADAEAPEEPPETMELMRFLVEDNRALRADLAMLSDTLNQALHEISTIPSYMLVPAGTWTTEVDEALIETKGITGKIQSVAEELELDGDAALSRYKALKSVR